MWKRVVLIWALVRGDLRLLWKALRHPLSPSWLKWGTAGVLLYLVSPIDLIPDMVPFFGIADDALLVPLAIRWLLKQLPQRVREDIEGKTVEADPTS